MPLSIATPTLGKLISVKFSWKWASYGMERSSLVFIDYIICEHWLYTVSLTVSWCLSWSLPKEEKKPEKHNLYDKPSGNKGCWHVLQVLSISELDGNVRAQTEITCLKRNNPCHLPQAEALLWTKEIPANPQQESRSLLLPGASRVPLVEKRSTQPGNSQETAG